MRAPAPRAKLPRTYQSRNVSGIKNSNLSHNLTTGFPKHSFLQWVRVGALVASQNYKQIVDLHVEFVLLFI